MKRFACLLALTATPALAELPTGEKTITLTSAAEKIAIGKVTFTGDGPSRKISVRMNHALFKDHFLSMRPFKCLEGPKFYCHLPYPYAWKSEITETDLADLEYALLFVQKQPNEYGINLFNGVYYKLTLEGGRMTGALHEVDMDTLASPPEASNLRPITDDLLTPAAVQGQWLPNIVIE